MAVKTQAEMIAAINESTSFKRLGKISVNSNHHELMAYLNRNSQKDIDGTNTANNYQLTGEALDAGNFAVGQYDKDAIISAIIEKRTQLMIQFIKSKRLVDLDFLPKNTSPDDVRRIPTTPFSQEEFPDKEAKKWLDAYRAHREELLCTAIVDQVKGVDLTTVRENFENLTPLSPQAAKADVLQYIDAHRLHGADDGLEDFSEDSIQKIRAAIVERRQALLAEKIKINIQSATNLAQVKMPPLETQGVKCRAYFSRHPIALNLHKEAQLSTHSLPDSALSPLIQAVQDKRKALLVTAINNDAQSKHFSVNLDGMTPEKQRAALEKMRKQEPGRYGADAFTTQSLPDADLSPLVTAYLVKRQGFLGAKTPEDLATNHHQGRHSALEQLLSALKPDACEPFKLDPSKVDQLRSSKDASHMDATVKALGLSAAQFNEPSQAKSLVDAVLAENQREAALRQLGNSAIAEVLREYSMQPNSSLDEAIKQMNILLRDAKQEMQRGGAGRVHIGNNDPAYSAFVSNLVDEAVVAESQRQACIDELCEVNIKNSIIKQFNLNENVASRTDLNDPAIAAILAVKKLGQLTQADLRHVLDCFDAGNYADFQNQYIVLGDGIKNKFDVGLNIAVTEKDFNRIKAYKTWSHATNVECQKLIDDAKGEFSVLYEKISALNKTMAPLDRTLENIKPNEWIKSGFGREAQMASDAVDALYDVQENLLTVLEALRGALEKLQDLRTKLQIPQTLNGITDAEERRKIRSQIGSLEEKIDRKIAKLTTLLEKYDKKAQDLSGDPLLVEEKASHNDYHADLMAQSKREGLASSLWTRINSRRKLDPAVSADLKPDLSAAKAGFEDFDMAGKDEKEIVAALGTKYKTTSLPASSTLTAITAASIPSGKAIDPREQKTLGAFRQTEIPTGYVRARVMTFPDAVALPKLIGVYYQAANSSASSSPPVKLSVVTMPHDTNIQNAWEKLEDVPMDHRAAYIELRMAQAKYFAEIAEQALRQHGTPTEEKPLLITGKDEFQVKMLLAATAALLKALGLRNPHKLVHVKGVEVDFKPGLFGAQKTLPCSQYFDRKSNPWFDRTCRDLDKSVTDAWNATKRASQDQTSIRAMKDALDGIKDSNREAVDDLKQSDPQKGP